MSMTRALTLAAALVCAACTSQTMPDGSTRVSLSPANLFQQQTSQPVSSPSYQPVSTTTSADYDPVLVQRVAIRFARDHRDNGMAGLVNDVAACYASALGNGSPDRAALRDCMALDVAAKRRDQSNVRRFHMPGMDYLADVPSLARLNKYGPLLFANEQQAMNFVHHTGGAVYAQSAQF